MALSNGRGAERVAEALNFGFSLDRNSRAACINGKMGEYNAAIGLASLDRWSHFSSWRRELFAFYSAAFSEMEQCRVLHWPEIGGKYILLFCENLDTSALAQEALDRLGIEFRFWYGCGLHLQDYPRRRGNLLSLPVTEELSSRLIGMPFALDLTQEEKEQLKAFASGWLQRTHPPGDIMSTKLGPFSRSRMVPIV